jgi:beta-lactam-binding protein with PASTA domain/tRNA A-37 threonylcarbamoyl transferase component Bud32
MDTSVGDPMVGRSLDSRYRVDALIARGGMASVYLATDTRLERRVAVKVIHPHLAEDPELAARFEREARAAARLSHPDVVSVYDQGTDASHAFLVMEYVPGATLRDVLRDRGHLELAEAFAVMDHVLSALAAAHEAGLVHRDVKPENVLLTADGRVKVADFGLARAVAGTTVTTTGSVLMGTAAYLPPEQVEHGISDARTDVYSAGVMLFELLTGAPPFRAENTYALLRKHVEEDIPAPSSRVRGIPAEVDQLVLSATARNPAHRLADASVMHTALLRIRERLGLHGRVPLLPVAATTRLAAGIPPVGPAGPAGLTGLAGPGAAGIPPAGPTVTAGLPDSESAPRRRRRRWPLILVALLVAIALAVTAGWWFASGRYTHAPNVTGKSRSVADAIVTKAGLHPHWLASVHSLTVKPGLVAVESPNGGARVSRHGTVDLRLSLGPQTHVLPTLQGSSVTSARQTLTGLHLVVSGTHHAYSAVAKGDVVGTDPAAGTTVKEGSSVALIISRGIQQIPIPAVEGMTLSQATAALHGLGFLVTHTRAYNTSVPAGEVVSSVPGAKVSAAKGSTVALVVSRGPRTADVPDVDGQSIDNAVQAIEAAGFTVNKHQVLPGGPGIVLRETPRGSQPVGTTITLDYF